MSKSDSYFLFLLLKQIIGFLVQQTRGFFADNVRLVECRNGSGETPLLRAMSVGAIPVIRVTKYCAILVLR